MGTTFKLQDNILATETVCNTACVHNKAIIIITMEIFKLPTYQNIGERISCCKGQVQFSYHFTHFDISRHDSPFHVVSGQFFFAGENALPCPDVDAYSALFLRNRDLICFWQPYWPLSFLQSLQNNKQTLSEKKEGQEMSASNGTKAGCSPFKDGPKNGPSKKKICTTLLDSAGPQKVQHNLLCVLI